MGRNITRISIDKAPKRLLAALGGLPRKLLEDGHFFVAFGFDALCDGYFLQIGWDCKDSWNNKEVVNHRRYNGDYIEIEDIGFEQGAGVNVQGNGIQLDFAFIIDFV